MALPAGTRLGPYEIGTLGNTNFGIISSAGAAREMQLSLKYLF